MKSQVLADWARYVFSPFAILAFFAGSVLTTLTGPFGTYNAMSLFARAGYWFSLIGVSIVLALTIRRSVDLRWAAQGFWTRSAITCLSFSVLFTGYIVEFNRMIFGIDTPSDLSVGLIFLIVLSVPLTVNPIIYFVLKMNGEEPNEVGETMPRLLKRLPESLGRKLVRVSVEDHYINVITEAGSERLLMRFGDAMNELDDAAGLQVHRSHWVAHDAVQSYWTDGSKTLLALQDGSHVPVSRNYRRQAQQAGLLANQIRPPKNGNAEINSV